MDRDEINQLAASLRSIDPKLLKSGKGAGTKRIWYQGEESYFDIIFELQNDEINWFQFTLRGKTLSWDKNNCRLQTGKTNELKQDDVTYYSASKVIKTDRTPDVDFIETVIAILSSRSGEPIFNQALALLAQEF